MEETPDLTPRSISVKTFRELAFAHRMGLPVDPNSEVRTKTDSEAMAIGSLGLRVDEESANRLEAEAEPFDERIEKAREALRAGKRASVEYLLGEEISNDDWEDLVWREFETMRPKKINPDSTATGIEISSN